MRIWFPKPLGDDVLKALRFLLPGHDISKQHDALADVLVEGRPTREQIASCPALQAVIVPFAGVSPPLLELMRDFPTVSLHNLHHNAPDTAETALTLLLAAAKRTIPMDQALRRNDWRFRYEPEGTQLLMGKTAVILGYGEVGKRIGQVLQVMGLHVIAVRRSAQADLGDTAEVVGVDFLHTVLPRAQVLIVTVPLTPETQHMIGQREFDLMPDGAIVINVARAQIIEEESFFNALNCGKLHSGGSDVWYRYPQEEGTAVPTYFVAPPSASNTAPANHPFGELPNMVLSPHRGGATQDTEERRVEHLAKMLKVFAEGNPMPNRVDLDRGY